MDNNKHWRFTKEEFEKKSLQYVINKVDELFENIDERIKDDYKKDVIFDKMVKFDYFLSKNNELNNKKALDIGMEIVIEDIYDWIHFSKDPNSSLEDIMIRTILSKKYNCSYICFSYLIMNNNFTEEFIENLIFVSSYLFDFDKWDDIHVKAVTESIVKESFTNDIYELYDSSILNKVPLIRLNLKEMVINNFSDEFKNKYIKYIFDNNNYKLEDDYNE